MKRSVYIISGPAGVGKSTTSKELVQSLSRSTYISGDDISHIPINGREKPWISEETVKLTWRNIITITKNLIEADFDVVIDYITFPKNVENVYTEIKSYDISIIYVVLMADLDVLISRDQHRPVDIQMGERSSILHREFEETVIDRNHVLDTTHYLIGNLEEIVEVIKADTRFLWSNFREAGAFA